MKNNNITASPIILYLMVTLSPLGIDLHLPALVEIKDYFNINSSLAQLSILIFVLSMGLGQLLFGIISDNLGKKKTALIGSLLFIIGSAGILISLNYYFVLFLRVLQGLGASAISVVAYATVNENYNDNEASIIFSKQSGFLNIIPATAPVVGAILLEISGWKLIFIFFTCYGLFTLFYILKYYQYIEKRNENNYKGLILELIGNRKFLLYACVCVYSLSYIMTYLNIAPILMIDTLKLSTLTFSIYFGINAIIISTVSFFLEKVISRFDSSKIMLSGLLLMTAASGGLFLFNNDITLYLFWSFIVIGSIGFASIFGIAISLALSDYKESSGLASGVLGFIYLSLSPIIAFIILLSTDVNYNIKTMGATFFILGVLLLLILSKDKILSLVMKS